MSILSTLAQTMEYDQSMYDSSYYDSYSTTTADTAAVAAAAGTMMIVFLVFTVITYVLGAFLLGRIFKKAGVEQWKAWVPIYNTWVMLELGDQKGFWSVLMFVPIVNFVAIVFLIMAEYHIGRKLGKSDAFVLLAIFLPIVWLIWLALDKSTWQGATNPDAQPAVAGTAPTATTSQPPANDTTNPPVPPQTPPTAS